MKNASTPAGRKNGKNGKIQKTRDLPRLNALHPRTE
jgi:hypothetical protein